MSGKASVSGEITFPAGTESFSGATIRVKLEDVSMMGGPSTVVAEQVMKNAHYDGKPIPFRLEGGLPADNDERSTYSVAVHVSMSGGGDISKGDYITMQSYPVLGQNPNRVQVQVRRV